MGGKGSGNPRLTDEQFAARHADFLKAMDESWTISEACAKVGITPPAGTWILKRLGYRRLLVRGRIR